MAQSTQIKILSAIALCWLALTITEIETIKLNNLIPQYCGQSLEFAPRVKEIVLKSTGNDSFINVGASVPQGVAVVANYKCFLMFQSPKGRGLILTVRKANLNENDTITFRSGTNPDRVWKQNIDEDETPLDEVVTVASKDHESTISVKYEPTVGRSPFNAGFDLAITVYREKGDTCGDDFDCLNDRCIDPSLKCDSYNNCGNDQDEAGCGAISWWIVAILIAIAVVVVVLAVLVWVRMSKA